MIVNEKIALEHGLNKEEYKKIFELLKRVPNITELGIFSAMWNEHCSYKSSKLHLNNLPTKGKIFFVTTAFSCFGDNKIRKSHVYIIFQCSNVWV